MDGTAGGATLRHFLTFRESSRYIAYSLAVGQVIGWRAYVRVASALDIRGQLAPHEASQSFETKVYHPNLDALAAVSGIVPLMREMGLNPLADVFAIGRLRRDDLPHPGYARLLRELPQQRNRHVGFDIVLAHVARVAAVVLQKLHHVVHVPGQVNGHRYGATGMDRGIRSGLLRR